MVRFGQRSGLIIARVDSLNPLAVSNGEEGFSLDISIGLNGEGSVSASDQNG